MGLSFNDLLELVKQYLNNSVTTGHKQFFNQFYSSFNMPAFIGEVITAVTNTSAYTFEVAPVATIIEKEMIRKMSELAGYPEGDGSFVTGGSNANLIALFSARNRALPDARTQGLFGHKKLTAFISDQAHYSFENNANVVGIGSDSIYKVVSDKEGRMIPEDLEKKILQSRQKGENPFFVAATAGTTMLGAFDPIEEIVEIGYRHNLWVHADGAVGATALLSPKHKHLLKGIEKTDSFSWDPHKLMNIPLICSVIIVRDKDRLFKNLTDKNDSYLYHDTENGNCDLGKKSIQCGKRIDSLKLWMAWKYYGDEGYAQRTEKLFMLADYFKSKVIENEDMELLSVPRSFTVCYRYKNRDARNTNTFNNKIREKLRAAGKSLVNYGYIGKDFSFRWAISNPEISKKDIDIFFENSEEIVSNLKSKYIKS